MIAHPLTFLELGWLLVRCYRLMFLEWFYGVEITLPADELLFFQAEWTKTRNQIAARLRAERKQDAEQGSGW